jgi:protein-S-isoprenylcysteine O-methyltransferase Ste14
MNTDLFLRIIFQVVFSLVVAISSYYRRRARQEGGTIARKEEGVLILALRMLGGLPLLVALLLYAFHPQALEWSVSPLPLWLRFTFAGIALLCIPASLWVFRSLGKNVSETILTKKGHELVTHGPYHWVRHPLYATALLLLVSTSVMAESWFLFAYAIAAVLIFRFIVIPQEEKRLVAAFGNEYREYQRRSGALLPKIF